MCATVQWQTSSQRFSVLPTFRIRQKLLSVKLEVRDFVNFKILTLCYLMISFYHRCIVFGARLHVATPSPSASPPVKHKHNVMLVTLSSAGVLTSAFLLPLRILCPLIRFCYVACSINCDTTYIYESKLLTATSSLPVCILQCIPTCLVNNVANMLASCRRHAIFPSSFTTTPFPECCNLCSFENIWIVCCSHAIFYIRT